MVSHSRINAKRITETLREKAATCMTSCATPPTMAQAVTIAAISQPEALGENPATAQVS
jgi:hypothetical protein